MRTSNERGIAMIITLLVMMLITALLVGFTAVVMSDARYRLIDKDRNQAFYGASGAMEKLTADLGNLFFSNVAPTASQVSSLTGNAPSISGVSYTAASAPQPLPASSLSSWYCPTAQFSTAGTNGYTVSFCKGASNPNPIATTTKAIVSGPYEGLIALQTPYQLDVTAKTTSSGEVHLIRTIESVAIPVFQFGMFSDVDLAFFAGPNFNFGGRVHTNGNLFLAEGDGATLTINNKVTAVKEVIRKRLQNNVLTSVQHNGTVSIATSSTAFRSLAVTEGSVVDGVNSALNDPTWHNVSLTSYNSYIRNGRTGAKALNLPLLTVGGSNPDLIRRPLTTETVGSVLYNERLFSKAGLRILLSDTAADITNLPGVTNTAPVQLDGNWNTTPPNNGTAYGPVDNTHPPIARSLGQTAALVTNAATAATDTTISVAAVTGIFANPTTLAIKDLTGAWKANAVCTGRTLTTFTGCNVTGSNATAGWTIYVPQTPGLPASTQAVAGSLPGVIPTAHLNANVNTGGGRTLTVSGGENTLGFAASTFWLTDVNGDGTSGTSRNRSTLVTCTGITSTSFTSCTHMAATKSGATITTGYVSPQDTGTIGGYIKIERQDGTGAWTDVTMEILNYGIGDRNASGFDCGDPTPNAIVRLQRLRDNGNAASCTIPSLTNPYEWWPNALFDAREGLYRDAAPASPNANDVTLGGVMYYVSLDATNLAKWLRGAAPYNGGTGAATRIDGTGYTVYFSDRRNNRDTNNKETGEFGFEDFVNPASSTGTPNNALDAGEDVNASGTLDTYGQLPSYNGISTNAANPQVAPLDNTARPWTFVRTAVARVNRAVLFRRALKLMNGTNIAATGVNGLTVVSENPVYIWKDWNAVGGFAGAHAATSVIADAVTLLSNNWTDDVSFTAPYDPARSDRGTAYYRVAIIAGKGMSFPQPSGTANDFGTDGGAHNFLRYLESGGTLNYLGSLATFFYNRQAIGTYKCCTTVYSPPTRGYNFDIDFLDPSKLPPNTPVFRDMNAVGFSQELRPGK